MPQIPELVDVILFFAPGFLLVQTLYIAGVGREHPSLDRLVWGIVLSIPIRWLAEQLLGLLDLETKPGLGSELIVLVMVLIIGILVGFILKEERETEVV